MWVQSLGPEDPPGGGHGNPLQYSCRENPMDRGAWRATVHGVAKSRTRLSDLALLLMGQGIMQSSRCQQGLVFHIS